MSSDSLNYAKLATTVAIKSILGAKKKVLSGKELTPDEAKFVGKCIGWFAIVSAGSGENDVFAKLNTLCEDVISESEKGAKLPVEPPAVLVGGKTRKMRGGAPLLISLIMGGIAILFGGNTGYQMRQTRAQRSIVLKEARAQIETSCPADILSGIPPSVSFFDFSGQEAAALVDYNTRSDVCNGVKQAVAGRIKQAEAAVLRADALVPKAVGALTTAASLVSLGPAAATPLGMTSAFGAGTAASTLTESMFTSKGNVASADVGKIVDALAKGFPAPSVAPSVAPAPGGRRRSVRHSRIRRMRTMRR
jgi:hypothetical protein